VAFATTPAVAWGGGQYLVAWVGRPSSTVDIVATRLSATGQVLGSPTTVLAGATGDNPRPAVAASGSEYLVAWTDKRNLTSNDIYGARVSFGGVVLDSAGVPISTAPGDEGNAAVASNGTEYLVTWERSAATWDVTGARVATSGTVEDVGGFVIAADAPSGTPPRAAYSPASAAYVVVYQRYSLGHVHDRFVEVTGCGDGVVQVAESCDDGGMVDGDGCSAECASEPGYTCSGAPSTCTDIDECATNNGGCAETCTNTAGGFMCSCAPGYTLAANGRTCEDLNECATSNGGCAQVCTNTLGSFECSCAAGYVLASDGLGCDDFDECATNNGGCSQVCTNTPGSFACSCAAGYQFASDGVTCEDINECLTNNGDCTQVCMNMPGSHECACHPGYMLDADGVTCPDIDECADGTAGCDRNAACANTSGSYTCTCDDGYTGDGHTCDRIDAPGGCGCRTNDARGSWVLVLACVGVLRRRTRAGTRRAWFARAG
jgi:fibulin 1/2